LITQGCVGTKVYKQVKVATFGRIATGNRAENTKIVCFVSGSHSEQLSTFGA